MKKLNCFLVLMLTLFMASCGNSGKGETGDSDNPNEVKLKVDMDLGELGEYLTVDDEVLIKLEEAEEDGVQGYVITSSIGVNVKKTVASNYSFGFDAEILDGNHIRIANFPSFEIESKRDYDNGDYSSVLYSGQKWATVKVGTKKEDWEKKDHEMWEKIRKEGVYIRIEPRYSSAKFVAYKGSNNSSSEGMTSDDSSSDDDIASISDESDDDIVSTSSGSEDWDELLKSYEQYVDKYISYLKKASKGDMTALSEYPALMEKAQKFSEKMKNAQSDMSASQWAKYNKITMKMLEAAQNMNE